MRTMPSLGLTAPPPPSGTITFRFWSYAASAFAASRSDQRRVARVKQFFASK